MPVKNYDSDIYLYAKNHYKSSGNTIVDLKHILGKRSSIDPEHIQLGDIISVLTSLVWKQIKEDKGSEGHMFFEFVSDISPQNWWKCLAKRDISPQNWWKCLAKHDEYQYDFYLAVIGKCLSILSLTQVYDGEKVLIELDEKDEELQARMLGVV